MIFWTEDIGNFELSTGMPVEPVSCELKDGRTGFYLGDDKKTIVESKGVTTEPISKNNLVTTTL